MEGEERSVKKRRKGRRRGQDWRGGERKGERFRGDKRTASWLCFPFAESPHSPLSVLCFASLCLARERVKETRRVLEFNTEKREKPSQFSLFFPLLVLDCDTGCVTNRCCLSFARSAAKQLVQLTS